MCSEIQVECFVRIRKLDGLERAAPIASDGQKSAHRDQKFPIAARRTAQASACDTGQRGKRASHILTNSLIHHSTFFANQRTLLEQSCIICISKKFADKSFMFKILTS